MNIVKSFADYMENNGYGVFGVNLFIGGAPSEAPSTCWWLLSGGGGAKSKNATLGKQNSYIVSVFYRNSDTDDVYEKLQALSDMINNSQCVDFDYELIEAEATLLPTDEDYDSEERTVGTIQVTITVYQS